LVGLGACVTLADSLIPQYGGNLRNIADIRERVNVNVCDVRDRFAMEHLLRTRTICSTWPARRVTWTR
jgi:hypothetical protein